MNSSRRVIELAVTSECRNTARSTFRCAFLAFNDEIDQRGPILNFTRTSPAVGLMHFVASQPSPVIEFASDSSRKECCGRWCGDNDDGTLWTSGSTAAARSRQLPIVYNWIYFIRHTEPPLQPCNRPRIAYQLRPTATSVRTIERRVIQRIVFTEQGV
jgi:hypothetical protein